MPRDTAVNTLIGRPAAAIVRLWQNHMANRHLRQSIARLQLTSAHLLADVGLTAFGVIDADAADGVDAPAVGANRQPVGLSGATRPHADTGAVARQAGFKAA